MEHDIKIGDKLRIEGKTYLVIMNTHKVDVYTGKPTAELKQVNE